MEKLKLQFATVSGLLFSGETRETYAQAIALTWSIIREIVNLLWLMFCSLFLVFFWGGNYARQAGKNLRIWYSDMDEDQKKNLIGAAAGTVQQSIGLSLSGSPSLVELAKSQLDIKNDPPALQAIPAAPKIEVKDDIKEADTSPEKLDDLSTNDNSLEDLEEE